MTEIPELKKDFAFLKKFDSRSKSWREFDTPKKGTMQSNFLMHPKRLSSDSECSSIVSTPRSPAKRFLSGTVLRTPFFQEENNIVEVKKVPSNESAVLNVEKLICPKTDTDGVLKNNKHLKKKAQLNQNNFDKKFRLLVEKSLRCLANIRFAIEDGIPSPDGDEDLLRRQKRLQEFSSRFSRNYLYPLLRQGDELSVGEKMGSSTINQKLLSALQVVLHALQAYQSHLSTSFGNCASDKLKLLLEQILYLCHLLEVYKKNSSVENGEFIHAIRNHVDLLSETITTFDLKITQDKPKPKQLSPIHIKRKKISKNKSKSKLSMYLGNSAFAKEAEIRRSLGYLTTKKSSIKSKYKTAGFKHRPPVEKPSQTQTQTPSDHSKVKFYRKCSSGLLRSTPTPRKLPIREDDIKTMVEAESQLQVVPPNTGEKVNHESSIDLNRLVQEQDCGNQNFSEEDRVDGALEVLRKFLGNSSSNPKEVLDKLASEIERMREVKVETEKKQKYKEPVVTVSGTRNAKLICIRDDNSVEEEELLQDKEIMTDVEVKVVSSETQTEVKNKKSGMKISRLPKNQGQVLKLLPKDFAISIIQYKLKYSQFHRNSPMYRKCTIIQPWDLMGRISDNILDNILASVANELEVNEILENIYNAEFQY